MQKVDTSYFMADHVKYILTCVAFSWDLPGTVSRSFSLPSCIPSASEQGVVPFLAFKAHDLDQ